MQLAAEQQQVLQQIWWMPFGSLVLDTISLDEAMFAKATGPEGYGVQGGLLRLSFGLQEGPG